MGDRTKLEEFDRRVGKWRDKGLSVPVASVKAALELRREQREKGGKR